MTRTDGALLVRTRPDKGLLAKMTETPTTVWTVTRDAPRYPVTADWRHAGQVVTRTMLLENVWDYHFDPQTNVIDVHVSRLRAKVDKGFDSALLHTVRGAGYMIRDGAR